MELNALRSREGSTILGAAVIDDVMGIILLSVVVAFARTTGGVNGLEIAGIVARMVLFFAAPSSWAGASNRSAPGPSDWP